MKRYWAATGFVLLLFLAAFLIAEQIDPDLLAHPGDLMAAGGIVAALAGVGLLVADVVLPVPSSLVMIAHGALFGLVVGTSLSALGSVGAALVGFALGRRGEPALARFVGPEERARANHLLNEVGVLAIIVTRPLPLLAETTMILAGASTMGWRPMVVAALAGSLPVAVLYAWAGATATTIDGAIPAFGLVVLMAGVVWVAGRRLRGAAQGRD